MSTIDQSDQNNAAVKSLPEEIHDKNRNPTPVPTQVDESRSVRLRTQTERGQAYEKDLVSKQLRAAYTKLQRQCSLFAELLLSNDVDMVHTECANLDKRLSEAEELHNRLLRISSDEEQSAQLNIHEGIDNQVFVTKQQACSWLKSQDIASRSVRSSSRSRSRHSKSQASNRSNKSKEPRQSPKRAASVHSTTSDSKLRIASLQEEQKDIEKMRVAKKNEFESKLRHETAKLDSKEIIIAQELRQAQLEEGILLDTDQYTCCEGAGGNQDKAPVKTQPYHANNDVIDVMKRLINLQTAPDIDIDVFSGNPLDYKYFRTTFREAVEKKVQDPRGRLTRLLKYTSGDAKDLIKHCIYEEDDTCFDTAISLLDAEYGNRQVIVNSYLSQLKHWPVVKLNDGKAYKKFHRFLRSGLTFQREGKLKELDSESIMRSMVLSKMDRSVQEKWLRKVVNQRANHGKELVFSDIVKFIEYQTLLVTDPSYSQEVYKQDTSSSSGIKTFATQCQVKFDKCPLCEGDHTIEHCSGFKAMTLDNRGKFIYYNSLCYGCLDKTGTDHVSKTCQQRKKCEVCKELHPTILHGHIPKVKSHSIHHAASSSTISMSIVPVLLSHKTNPENEIKVYALLDENSQGIFIQQDLLGDLKAPTRLTCITTETINGQFTDASSAADGLRVKPLPAFEKEYKSNTVIELPTAYSREIIAFHEDEVPTASKIKQWKYLHPLLEKLPEFDASLQLGLIIGANCPKALEPQEVICSDSDGPYASRSPLGWRIIGPIGGKEKSDTAMGCHRIRFTIPLTSSLLNTPSDHHLAVEKTVKEDAITQSLEKMYHRDFPEQRREKIAMSYEDKQFIGLMESSIYKQDGHYHLPMPFRESKVVMPNNRGYALKRLLSTKRKMERSDKYKEGICKFINTLLEKGYAKRSDEFQEGRTWYIPHHGVWEETKNKYRVVFDCSARFHSRSLNDELLQGPDLTNLLVGVLLRFRRGKYGFIGDIEAMFHQVRVPPEFQTYLKFLWWPNGDLTKSPEDYQMCVHLFGAISSPSCANFALRQTVVEGVPASSHAREVIRENFYVDDMLASEDEVSSCVEIIREASSLCSSAGFNLTKFTSNSKEVLDSVASDKRAVQDSILLGKSEFTERALGVHWWLESDTLGFRIKLQDTPLTRRGILSTVSSIYDPLGIASPFLLEGRKILQSITTLKDGWDAKVPADLAALWSMWRSQLPELQRISVPRCYKPVWFGDVVQSSLHMFSDASEVGYGVASYLRQVDSLGNVSVSLVLGKSRVTPTKPVTIPRLELTACSVSVKLGAMIKEELKIPGLQDHYLTDSTISLGYIYNETRRFRVFVANRAQTIRSYTSKEQWRHVESGLNPADHASRGISVNDEKAVNQWINGPEFLWKEMSTPNYPDLSAALKDDDPEIRGQVLSVHTTKLPTDDTYLLTKLEEQFSCWKRILRVVAIMIKFAKQARKLKPDSVAAARDGSDGGGGSGGGSGHVENPLDDDGEGVTSPLLKTKDAVLSVSDLMEAQTSVIRMIQQKYFPASVKDDKLSRLDPFICNKQGILKVGGRVRRADFTDTAKHPVILPRDSIISRRVIEYYHSKVSHSGRTTTLNAVRQYGFWIVGANGIVRSIINKCITCRALRGKLGEQKMSDLPKARFSEEGPFTYTGMDMFGPFYTKDGRKQQKRFVTLFTCMSSRAVHLESMVNMNTDSFIQALRRFLARRGVVREIVSDNGKNFVGAENEWRKAFNLMDHAKVNDFLLDQSCDWIVWKKNPPSSSHMGGVWERQIRSVRSVLTAMLRDHSSVLNDEAFRTLLTEAECIVNSRPLTVENLHDPTSLPLSPNTILTMKTKVVLPPPGIFQREDIYCRKRWRQVQHLANEFWARWRKEYVTSLQERQKWHKAKTNFLVNDVVLLKDEDLPRNQWPLARIAEVFPSQDGLVRRVKLFLPTAKSNLERPIHKLIRLVGADEM